MNEKLKFSGGLFRIIFSAIIISGGSFFIFSKIQKNNKNNLTSQKYEIKAIGQNQNEVMLNVNYLAQLMELSSSKPSNLFLFDEKKAEESLLSSPVIKSAKVKKMKPDCLFVDYVLRKPVAYLYDFENTAIDEEGHIFPVEPFFPPQDLCKFYLGIGDFTGYEKVDCKRVLYALDIYDKLKSSGFADLVKIKVLDTSRLELQSYGKREILLYIEEELKVQKKQKDRVVVFPIVLRLALSNYLEQIGNYLSLRLKILKDYDNQIKDIDLDDSVVKFKPKTIDLRLSKLAFIDQ